MKTITLTRLGDFYEAYGDEAETLATALNLTLTGRNDKQPGDRVPMAGVPAHAIDRYVAALEEHGFLIDCVEAYMVIPEVGDPPMDAPADTVDAGEKDGAE